LNATDDSTEGYRAAQWTSHNAAWPIGTFKQIAGADAAAALRGRRKPAYIQPGDRQQTVANPTHNTKSPKKKGLAIG